MNVEYKIRITNFFLFSVAQMQIKTTYSAPLRITADVITIFLDTL